MNATAAKVVLTGIAIIAITVLAFANTPHVATAIGVVAGIAAGYGGRVAEEKVKTG